MRLGVVEMHLGRDDQNACEGLRSLFSQTEKPDRNTTAEDRVDFDGHAGRWIAEHSPIPRRTIPVEVVVLLLFQLHTLGNCWMDWSARQPIDRGNDIGLLIGGKQSHVRMCFKGMAASLRSTAPMFSKAAWSWTEGLAWVVFQTDGAIDERAAARNVV